GAKGDKALGIDYGVSVFPTFNGVSKSVYTGARAGYQISRRHFVTNENLGLAAKAALAYASLC
ncbi:MAG: hypothetical protein AABY07_08100, partial [Nanoarchaeota archaeon]